MSKPPILETRFRKPLQHKHLWLKWGSGPRLPVRKRHRDDILDIIHLLFITTARHFQDGSAHVTGTECRETARWMDLDEFNVALSGTYRRLWLMAAALSGDRVQADDLVQETALIALRRRQQFRRGSNFTAWMAAILRFVVLNHNRRRSRRKTFPVDPVHLDRTMAAESVAPTKLENTTESWRQLDDDQTEFDDMVVEGLKSLSPEARLCLLLSVVEELPYAEIAEMLEIPEGTVASHVHRAKRLLRDSLRPAIWRKP